jgi:hypothetical protein
MIERLERIRVGLESREGCRRWIRAKLVERLRAWVVKGTSVLVTGLVVDWLAYKSDQGRGRFTLYLIYP